MVDTAVLTAGGMTGGRDFRRKSFRLACFAVGSAAEFGRGALEFGWLTATTGMLNQ